MIKEIRVKNCFAFNEEIVFSMNSDMRNKKFGFNVFNVGNFNILKSAGIFGPNNAGKTCLISCIRSIKMVMLNKENLLQPNFLLSNYLCELSVTFIDKGREFLYSFKYNFKTKEYEYESFFEIKKDANGNESKIKWLFKDSLNDRYECFDENQNKDENIISLMSNVSKEKIFCYSILSGKSKVIDKIREIMFSFASKIDVINMNNIPIQHTIDLIKNENNIQSKIVEFIKKSDLYMENFEFVEPSEMNVSVNRDKAEETVLNNKKELIDMFRLMSTYKGKKVPSIVYDSTGTKKIAALASYIIEALENNRILVVDELDNSLHFKLTRAIVSMFNNEKNEGAQLIFTAHDVNLIDCKKLFRKEQIWFIHKDLKRIYAYPLSEFTAKENGVRDTTDIIKKYKSGAFGAIPDPDFSELILNLKNRN